MKIKKIKILNDTSLTSNSGIINKIGKGCYCSDLGRLTGVDYDIATGNGDYWFDGPCPDKRKYRTTRHVTKLGSLSFADSYKDNIGLRLSINFDDIEDFDIDKIDELKCELPLVAINGIGKNTIKKLFDEESNLIILTGRYHEINNVLYPEYEVLGIRFILFKCLANECILSDGTKVFIDQDVILKVESIPFIVDKNEKKIYSSIILMATKFDQNDRKYPDSSLKRYLDNYFIHTLNDELEHDEPKVLFQEDNEKYYNRYNFDFDDISEEEIVEICINSNIAVFMHGMTGSGKTQRVKALDKDLELVDFGCTSADGFTGIIAKDFNSKELTLYEPFWYKSLCNKCKKDSQSIHILFLEELTNAKNDVQKVAFEVTLNKTLTNSGFRLKLPDNAVVLAAGNEADESRSASKMSEPLFGRFAHVYIDTNSDKWLTWAQNRLNQGKTLKYKKFDDNKTIHPSIMDYIKVKGDSVLRTPYNGKTPNADPRKWEMASRALYECNNPNVLRALVGEEITNDFIKFCKIRLVTIDDILNDRIVPDDVPVDASVRWATIVCLSNVDDDNVEKIRDFVRELGNEYLATFDYEWSKNNNERIMKLYSNSSLSHIRKLGNNANI